MTTQQHVESADMLDNAAVSMAWVDVMCSALLSDALLKIIIYLTS